MHKKLFQEVVPHDQTFKDDEYAGIFHFRSVCSTVLGPTLVFAECDKHYPSRHELTSLATANIEKPVIKIYFGYMVPQKVSDLGYVFDLDIASAWQYPRNLGPHLLAELC